jgi:hypothetical protein
MRSFENGRKMGGQKLFSRFFDILLEKLEKYLERSK